MPLYTRRKKQQLLKDMKEHERKSTKDDGIHPKSKQLKEGHKHEESSETETAPDYIIYHKRIGPKTNYYNDLGKNVLGIKRNITQSSARRTTTEKIKR